MKNCNMPNCNMPRYDIPHMSNDIPHMSNVQPRYMHDSESCCMCDDYPIGMAYVPWQKFKDLYEPERGLHAGTIFMELDKPFTGRRPYRR